MRILPTAIVCMLSTLAGISQDVMDAKHAFPGILGPYPSIRDLALTAAGDEAYVTAQSPTGEVSVILELRRRDGSWTDPVIASFSGRFHDLEPFLSPDNLRLYFASNRPLDTRADTAKDYDIWYVERATLEDPWSGPVNPGTPLNSESNEFYPAVAGNGNMYFTSDREGTKGRDDIFFSQWERGKYSNPVTLGDSVNTDGFEYNAYIAPDESLLLFGAYNRADGLGSGDIYVSDRRTDGSWSKARNMGPGVNSAQMDYCPFLHLDSSTLYFTSRRSNVSLDQVRTADELLKEYNRYDNGMSRIYQIPVVVNKGQDQHE